MKSTDIHMKCERMFLPVYVHQSRFSLRGEGEMKPDMNIWHNGHIVCTSYLKGKMQMNSLGKLRWGNKLFVATIPNPADNYVVKSDLTHELRQTMFINHIIFPWKFARCDSDMLSSYKKVMTGQSVLGSWKQNFFLSPLITPQRLCHVDKF